MGDFRSGRDVDRANDRRKELLGWEGIIRR